MLESIYILLMVTAEHRIEKVVSRWTTANACLAERKSLTTKRQQLIAQKTGCTAEQRSGSTEANCAQVPHHLDKRYYCLPAHLYH